MMRGLDHSEHNTHGVVANYDVGSFFRCIKSTAMMYCRSRTHLVVVLVGVRLSVVGICVLHPVFLTIFLYRVCRFASQFSANHIQFRIAKLRFCIANCDAIPDKFIPEVYYCCRAPQQPPPPSHTSNAAILYTYAS